MTRVRSGGPWAIARLFLSVLMICTAHGAASAEEKTILPSELLANPNKYEGKHMILRGCVIIRPEARFLCDSQAAALRDETVDQNTAPACLGLMGPGGQDINFHGFHSRYRARISGAFVNIECKKDCICLYFGNKDAIEAGAGSKF